jgi:acyl-CoA thioesterase
MTSNIRVPLPDPKGIRTWAEQMSIEQISAKRFRSLAGAPYGNFVNRNGEPRARAFGGHVYAQAAYATSKTVDPGFVIHVSRQSAMSMSTI